MSIQIQPDLIEESLQKSAESFVIVIESLAQIFGHSRGVQTKMFEEHSFLRLGDWLRLCYRVASTTGSCYAQGRINLWHTTEPLQLAILSTNSVR
jgi:hypothetical protein